MNEPNRDIYRKEERKDRGPLPSYEVPHEELASRTRRNMIIGFSIMVVVLAVTAIVTYVQDLSSSSEKLDAILSGAGRDITNRVTPRSLIRSPENFPQIDFTFDEKNLEEQTGPEIAPVKMAEAMGHIRIAQQYLRQREWDRAESEVRQSLEIWPEMNVGLLMLGSIFTQRGQLDQAILMLERVLKKDPFNPETFNNLAINYMQKEMMGKAEELLITSLQIRPDYFTANLNLGLLYLRWGRYDQAADHYLVALKELPDHPSLLNNLAVCYIRMGDYEEARRYLEQLIRTSPERSAPYFNMAITYTLDDNVNEALRWIREGARHTTPSRMQAFLSDSDFNSIREHPEFKRILREAFPDIPVMTGVPGSS